MGSSDVSVVSTAPTTDRTPVPPPEHVVFAPSRLEAAAPLAPNSAAPRSTEPGATMADPTAEVSLDYMQIELRVLRTKASTDPDLQAALDLVLNPHSPHGARSAARLTLFRALYGTGRRR